jgi:hypothetical protein
MCECKENELFWDWFKRVKKTINETSAVKKTKNQVQEIEFDTSLSNRCLEHFERMKSKVPLGQEENNTLTCQEIENILNLEEVQIAQKLEISKTSNPYSIIPKYLT